MMTIKPASPSLPTVERARRYIATLPAAESGNRGHDATFRAACVALHGFALSEDAAYALLSAEFNPRCKPPWSASELGHKIKSAAVAPQSASTPRGYLLGTSMDTAGSALPTAAPLWPEVVPSRRKQALANHVGAAELCDRSPVTFEPGDSGSAAEILELLFSTPEAHDPLLCIGRNNADFATRPLSAWVCGTDLATSALVVPSPMSARTGRTKAGKESEHTLENTGPRRFLIVEFDHGGTDEHAALLWHLSGYGPLTLVVHSGGKSLHGWFYCQGQSDEALRRFMAYAVSIGADRATWTRSQFVRLPAGRRENGAPQNVFYFAPAATQTRGGELE